MFFQGEAHANGSTLSQWTRPSYRESIRTAQEVRVFPASAHSDVPAQDGRKERLT